MLSVSENRSSVANIKHSVQDQQINGDDDDDDPSSVSTRVIFTMYYMWPVSMNDIYNMLLFNINLMVAAITAANP